MWNRWPCKLRLKTVTTELLNVMTSSISRNGPDGNGTWCDSNVGLGHSRLSIIDLSMNASQPFVSFDGRYIMSYNGEVYNYITLKDELKRGYKFKSNSDSEVVLLFVEWGTGCLKNLVECCAQFMIKKQKKCLLLEIDTGQKPLYYSEGNNFFAGSEQRAITKVPNLKKIGC